MKNSITNSQIQIISDTQYKSKMVTFNEIITIHSFVDFEDRKSYWIENRCHFQRRCDNIQNTISFIFENKHRAKIKNIIQKYMIQTLNYPEKLKSLAVVTLELEIG